MHPTRAERRHAKAAPVMRLPRALSTTSHVLMAGSLALAMLVATAPAQAQQPATSQSVAYDIPAGPLDQSLNLFAARSRILLVVDPALTRGKRGPALQGSYSNERALELLLSGSGLEAERRADGGVVIRARTAAEGAALPTVTVTESLASETGLKREASGGALGSRSLLDTPFSITVVDKDDIQERQVTNVEQAFRYDASVTSASGEYGRGSSLLVRGLGLDDTNGFKVDGLALPGWGNDLLPMEAFERVELLKGLSGFMYGFGSPGGIMNYVMKRPTDDTTFSADVGYKTDSLFYKHIDAGGRAGEDQRFGYRVNVSQEQGGTYIKGGSIDRLAASLALDMKLSNDLKWTFDTLYARRNSKGNAFWGMYVSNTLGVPTAMDPSTRVQPQGAYYNNENTVVTTGLEWKINPDWKASFSWRYARENVDTIFGDMSIDNAAGDTSTTLTSYIYAFQHQQLQAMLEGKAKTGDIGHQLVFGASHQVYEVLGDRGGSYYNYLGSGNIWRDTSLSIGNATTAGDTLYMSARTTQDALFASDTVSFNDKWSLIAGLRYVRFDQGSYSQAGLRTARYQRSPLTPTVALMYKPVAAMTTYVSYVEALEQGGTAGATTANAGETLPPVKSKQVEAGVKLEQDRWSATAAVFRLQRANEYTNSANYYVQDGEMRYQGIDISGQYNLTRELSLAGGIMLLDAKYQKASSDLIGKHVTGAAPLQEALSARYRVPGVEGLTLNAGGRFVGRSKLDTSANQLELSPYTLFDAGAVYRTRLAGKEVTFNAQLQNLGNRRYWVYNGGNYIFAGAPRTLSLNARVEF